MKNDRKYSEGFTLLEVLVAVLVLSFGLLGIAGLLLATVQNNTVAAQRTTATFLAQDMADRIRSNINATKQFTPAGTPKPVFYLNSTGTLVNCFGATPSGACATGGAVAGRDLFIWNRQIATSLPAGDGIVCQDLTPDDGSSFAQPACDNITTSPWVIKIFWRVRAAEDQVGNTNGIQNVQRFATMLGGT
jgi:type IV pilus assembly protein PilV